jgi:hypothetical protein
MKGDERGQRRGKGRGSEGVRKREGGISEPHIF